MFEIVYKNEKTGKDRHDCVFGRNIEAVVERARSFAKTDETWQILDEQGKVVVTA